MVEKMGGTARDALVAAVVPPSRLYVRLRVSLNLFNKAAPFYSLSTLFILSPPTASANKSSYLQKST